jgi:hypothetical protein
MKKQNSSHEKKNFRLSVFDCDGLLKSWSEKSAVDGAELSEA